MLQIIPNKGMVVWKKVILLLSAYMCEDLKGKTDIKYVKQAGIFGLT